jgi:integrase
MVLIGRGRYRSKSFDKAKAAAAWAEEEAGKIRFGVVAPAGRCLMSQVLPDYLRHLDEAGRSASHRANVERTLLAVRDVAPELDAPDTEYRIDRWLAGLTAAAASKNRKLVEIRGLVRWLMRRRMLGRDPIAGLRRVTESRPLKAQFSADEVMRLVALPTPDPSMHRRVALMLLAGLRDDEAAALRWRDLDLGGGAILVRKVEGRRLKRNKERILPLQAALRSILGPIGEPPTFPAYDASKAPEMAKPRARDEAAARARGTGLDGQVAPILDPNLRRSFPAYLLACGVPVDDRTPHSCRHTFAGLMTASGVPTALLAAYMGHASAVTTFGYAQAAARHVQAAAGWPRGELRVS